MEVITIKLFNKVTPEGTKDKLFDECEKRSAIGSSLRNLFCSRGFKEVSTPVLEYYDVFKTSCGYFPQESMYKLVDQSGRLLVLRPDCTIPIARLTGSRLKNEKRPLRIFYDQNVYRYPTGNSGVSGEISQMGVEYIGSNLPICDVEIVELACNSLGSSCGGDYQLELCHIGYFKALIESLGTDENTSEQIRELVEHKNFPALDSILENFKSCKASVALKKLPALFGSISVIDEARSLFSSEKSDAALDYLAYIYRSLSELGIEKHLTIDLGLVNQADYYTGIIFRGYTAGAGEPVLAGGRYDLLIEDFGAGRPATGFGINLDLLCEKISSKSGDKKSLTAAVLADSNSSVEKAFGEVNSLIKNGYIAEIVAVDSAFDDFQYQSFDKVISIVGDIVKEVKA